MNVFTAWRRSAAALVLLAAAIQAAGAADDAERVRRGAYLALAGDCIACHTAPGGKPMAGGLAIPSPLGTMVSTNITPSKTHGIGNYTLAQFSAALREGIRADRQRLYPGMPYTSYALVTDEDVQALYAYFMQSVQAVDESPPPTRLPFPFNVRALMVPWNLLFLHRGTFVPDDQHDADWNRGAYLVRGLAHCSTCHSPRNVLMAENRFKDLGGGAVGSWSAPNITSDAVAGIGGWSADELVAYLREGHAAGKSQAAGPMAEAVDNSLRHLTEADLRAMASFLKTVPPLRLGGQTRPAYAWGVAADDLQSIRGVAWPADTARLTGPQLYDAWCASCHQARAQGSFDGGMPSLFHNATVGRAVPNNLVMVVLEGLHRHPDVNMPDFSRQLTDEQVATLATYVRHRWGDPQSEALSRQLVERLRGAGGGSSPLLLIARIGIGMVVLLLVGLAWWGIRRRRRAAH